MRQRPGPKLPAAILDQLGGRLNWSLFGHDLKLNYRRSEALERHWAKPREAIEPRRTLESEGTSKS